MYLKSGIKNECSGCTACKSICTRHAIEMIEDEEGFKYPHINKDKCIDCGACYRICPNIKKDESNTIMQAYGVKHKNEKERMTSRSGGVFIALSDYILNLNGVVYGAEQIMTNSEFNIEDLIIKKNKEKSLLKVVHNRATTKEERNKFKGSKYIQSDMGDIIKDVQKDLRDGKKVLFSGTPCQVAGIKAVISEINQQNLYTCDLICHGVPSSKVFQDFLRYLEKKSNKKIKEFNFRDKRFGWDTHYETTIFEDTSEITTQYFRDLFYGHNILRPSCYNCNYANIHRPADITIADFWGIDEVAPEFMDKKGVSLVIVNNEKGKGWFEEVKDEMNIITCSIKDCLKHTYTLNEPTPLSEQREEFWNDYENYDFQYIIDKYTNKRCKIVVTSQPKIY